jgi:hypothetical protein
MDHLYEILSGFLDVRPVQSDTTSSLYRMWAIVRDIANICFVIAFMFIVYSQITSMGISNYNLKRMLPRLIVAAILVNISFWISALAVDLSNFLGHAIHDLFVNIFKSLNTAGQYKDIQSLSWQSISTAILSGGAIVTGLGLYANFVVLGTGLPGALILLIPILVGVLFAVLVALLVMAARQALITCLIIISPLAFVAYLLPNTEKYFDKWKDLFMTMLLLYPIFSVIFGAAQLAGLAIIQNANSLNLVILGMAVMVAPVVITPLLVKFSGSFVGRLANMVNNPRRGVMDRTKNWAQGRAQEEKAKILAGQGRNNWANRRTVAIDRKRRRKDGWKKAYETMADNNFAETGEGVALEGATRRAANDRVRIDNAFARTAIGRQVEYQSRIYNLDKQRVENEFNDSHEGHAVDRTHRVVEMDKKRIEGDHETNWNNEVRTNPELLRQSMQARASEVRAELSKNKLEQLNTEIAAQGKDNEYILNLRGVDAQTQAGMLNVAHDIKRGNMESAFTATAKAMAERQIAENKAAIMNDNTMVIDGKSVVEYAAGIKGDIGMRSVVAQAKTERSRFMVDDVKNIEATLDYNISSNANKLLEAFQNAKTDAERVAFTSIMAKRGAPGATNLRVMAQEMDRRMQNGLISQDEMNDYKELVLAQNSNIMGLGKDLEFFYTNAAYGADDPDPRLAGKIKTFDEITNETSTWANLSAEAFSRMNIVNQLHGLRILAHKNPAKYRTLVSGVLSSPSARANLKDAVVDAIAVRDENGFKYDGDGNILMVQPDDSSWMGGQYNTPTRDELTEFESHTLFEPELTQFAPRPEADQGVGDADYWRQKYLNQRQATERYLDKARDRGIDYRNL